MAIQSGPICQNKEAKCCQQQSWTHRHSWRAKRIGTHHHLIMAGKLAAAMEGKKHKDLQTRNNSWNSKAGNRWTEDLPSSSALYFLARGFLWQENQRLLHVNDFSPRISIAEICLEDNDFWLSKGIQETRLWGRNLQIANGTFSEEGRMVSALLDCFTKRYTLIDASSCTQQI